MKNKIERLKCNFDIINIENENGLKINSKKNNEQITIYDDDLIEKMIENKFNKRYRELLYLVYDLNESDDTTDSDTELALIKIEDFREKLLTKYQKYINKNKMNKYLKMLILLSEKIEIPKRHRGR